MNNKGRIFISLIIIMFSITVYSQSTIKVSCAGEGKPVIFLPSLGCPGELWNGVVSRLSKQYKCYIVSIAGFAGMPLQDDFGVSNISSELIKYIKDKGIEKPILLGHSFGGFLALSTASSYPNIFSKLIIVDASPFALGRLNPNITLDQAKQQALILKNITLQQSEDDFKKNQAVILTSAISDSTKSGKVLNWMLTSNRTAIAQAQFEMLSTDLRESVKNIMAPTLVMGTWIAGKQYGITKEMTEQSFKMQYGGMNNCTLIISDKKHFIMHDDPDWFNNQIEKFLEK